MYDLIIVGGGPAGLTAAIYAIRRRLNVLLLSEDLGGKTNLHQELPDEETHQVIRGTEVVEKFKRELSYLEFALRMEKAEAIEKKDGLFTVKITEKSFLEAKSVILATGSQVKQLGVPGENDYIGKGVIYSAVSYAPLFIEKCTVVVGDGELALRAVAELARVAASIHLIAPTHGALDSPLAEKIIANNSDKVVVLEGYKVKAIQGGDFAERVILATPHGKEIEISADGIFVELGLVPNSAPVKGLAEFDDKGRVVIDQRNRTNCPGLFAAGDVTDSYAEQVLIAVGEGAKVALSAYEYILTH